MELCEIMTYEKREDEGDYGFELKCERCGTIQKRYTSNTKNGLRNIRIISEHGMAGKLFNYYCEKCNKNTILKLVSNE